MNKIQQEETEKFLLSLPKGLMDRVREEAKEKYRSVSGQVGWILEQYFHKQTAT